MTERRDEKFRARAGNQLRRSLRISDRRENSIVRTGRQPFRVNAIRGRALLPILILGALAIPLALVVRAHRQQAVPAPDQAANGHYAHTNKLIGETSPYLLQHAHNPVNWYPWGQEALEKAKRENKPIFLSIGYSACHWCHVMERESFENEEIAKLLNENFVSIKVDREQRPDIDAQYMLAVQMMTGSGGWPLSVFLIPDRKPFFGGTYFPPEEFKQVLAQLAQAFKTQPEKVQSVANRVAAALAEASASQAGGKLPADVLQQAVAALERRYDPQQGGFAQRPKFPEAPNLAFLLARYRQTGDKSLLAMVTNTLDHMAAGGIYDQLGGGFHRYSTDAMWRVPHFEKMLYDQAQLVPIYLDASQIKHERRYRQIAEETLDFVAWEMRDKEGGFYSSIDADSEGEEGKFYLWTPDQVREVLGGDAPLFEELFGVTGAGDLDGKSVLHIAEAVSKAAGKRGMAPDALSARVEEMRQRMFAARSKRVRPRTDDKVLASWNGLMIAAFGRGYQSLGRQEYLRDAVQAADFLSRRMTLEGRLMHSYRGRAEVPGQLDDYAFTSYGLLALYDATREKLWLARAEDTAREMVAQFWDKGAGGFYSTASASELLARLKSAEDEALPSGNGLAAQVMARLAQITRDPFWKRYAEQTEDAFAPAVARAPAAFPTLLAAYQTLGMEPSAAREGVVQATAVALPLPITPGTVVRIPLRVSVKRGWHINSHQPSAGYLIATRLTLAPAPDARLASVNYPQGESVKYGFSSERLSVYQGDFTLEAIVQVADSAPAGTQRLRFILSYQPCNDRACLAPASVDVEAPIHVGRR